AEQGKDAAAAVIAEAIGDADLSDLAVGTVREALSDVGAVDAVELRIVELTATSMAALERAHLVGSATAALTELVVKATQRTY
ncbi:polyprenyl synthetase family protein, partial [Amycolatopsis sp. H20-H5]|nr:polyprenyl synthetase family protein [Amycolatopsis sp. H20-H5]